MTDIDKALLDPTSVFRTPEDVLKANDITRDQKIEILRRWEYDARELEVAADENMIGNNSDLLERVLKSLGKLGYESDPDKNPPTKQGGA
ncbi:MAG TPA: hypothetical protein VJV40_08335 [Thermodesulfobacteriota bacterium]|nr:hypothetical protein [Thermodesulfobacteriota bacterium]